MSFLQAYLESSGSSRKLSNLVDGGNGGGGGNGANGGGGNGPGPTTQGQSISASSSTMSSPPQYLRSTGVSASSSEPKQFSSHEFKMHR
jgi:hypothetical protein